MNKEIKIKSSCIPEEPINVNEWCEMFKVGTRVDKYKDEDRSGFLNSQYDFVKLFKSPEKDNLFNRLKSLKLVNLW